MQSASASTQSTEPVLCGALVADGVRRYDDGIVNWYLIESDDGLTVIDAGFPPDWKMLTASLGTLGRRLGDVKALVLTHAHIDHIGFAERLRRECGAPVLVHEDDAPLARSPLNVAKSSRGPLRYLNHAATRSLMLRSVAAGAPLSKTVRELTTFTDGETLDVPGSLQVVYTPGHTDGHCALHLAGRDVLFVGDALVTRDPYTGRTGPRIVAAAATKDPARNLQSLDRIAATGAGTLLPGHGEPWTGGAAEAVRLAREAGPA